jgi:PPOX class probable F420-dependent enzyme
VAMLTAAQRSFLADNAFCGVVTTLRDDGSPHSTVVWVDVDEDGVSFNTAHGRAKTRHLERDARLSLVVVNPHDAYEWVSISGRAELVDDGADAQIDRLAEKYLGADTYPWRSAAEQRVSVRITPSRVEARGVDEE